MKMQNHWIKDISDVLESLEHGHTLTKFVAKHKNKDGDSVNGIQSPSVEIHGFITSNGEFIIISEQFSIEENK